MCHWEGPRIQEVLKLNGTQQFLVYDDDDDDDNDDLLGETYKYINNNT
jgi:hypothetical protein